MHADTCVDFEDNFYGLDNESSYCRLISIFVLEKRGKRKDKFQSFMKS